MRRKSTVFLVFVLIFTMLFTTTVSTARTKDEVNKELNQKRNELKEGQAKAKALEKSIQELEIEIAKVDEELDKINAQLEETEQKIEQAEEELKEAEEKVNTQENNLNQRLRTMYKSGSVGYLDVILNSGSISDLISNLEMVKIIYSSDQDVLKSLQESYDLIEEKKEELETLQADIKVQQQEQKNKQTQLEADKAVVKEKKGIIDANNTETQDNIAALERESAKIDAQIAADSNKNNGGGSGGEHYTDGVFTHPCPGYKRISSKYGYRICPNHGPEIHSGIDLAANEGVPIYAAAGGVVVTSQYNYSYGYYIVISHGGGLYTLYAHCSRLLVRSGAKVSKGQQIAKVGTTGESTGPHLHFEVRKGGNSRSNHVDPTDYVNF